MPVPDETREGDIAARRIPTRQDIIDFLTAKANETGPMKCPCCASTTWVLGSEPSSFLSAQDMYENFRSHGSSKGILPKITLACDNCGLIREHAFLPISKWLDENGR